MRILHILDHSIPLHSGYAFRTRSILLQQRNFGWETTHLTSSKHYAGEALEEDVDGFHFFRTYSSNMLLDKLPLFNQYAVVRDLSKRLRQVVEKVKPQILHAHSPCLNGLAALQVGKAMGLPVVYELRASWEDAAVSHGSTKEKSLRYRLSHALETYVLKRADAITTICEGLKSDIVSRGVAAEKVTIIPNAVDLDSFSAARGTDYALRQSLGLDKRRVLGFIGSFYDYEGLDLLLKALPIMRSTYPDIALLLVGGGPRENALRELVVKLGIQEHVIFTGRVSHDDVGRYYDLIDILVYPRKPMRLTEIVTPLKPLEAMAGGRLLIASDVGGHRELIRDGITGTLFKAGDTGALAGAVCDLLENHHKWPERLENARRFVETERNWRGSVEGYRSVYNGLLHR
ncbi:MAG TPA: glycosyltransferase, exosortase A system-associated [Chromatiales bacterium]|nr:glycosyltransferase, exosortase A system-associated [Chromatiales bacterium]